MEREKLEIDLQEIFMYLLYRCWVMILAMVIFGGIAFGYTYQFVTPMYQSDAKLYVNATASIGSVSISATDVGAGSDLIETYTVILQTRDTLQEIIDYTECGYSQGQLSSMISASAVGSTDIMNIVVTNEDPIMAEKIASSIAKILPDKISEIIDGTSVRVVDTAIVPSYPVSPNYTNNVAKGAMLGLALSGLILVLRLLLETKITSMDYLKDTYGDIPLLAVIPIVEVKKEK